MFSLTGPSRPPARGGKPKQLVIFLHGLGADGNDLIGLAQYWSGLLPDAEFISPNAPFPCTMAGYGYQWLNPEDRSPEARLAGARAAGALLDGFIDEELAKRGLAAGDAALVGFSQGCMMSLFVGPRRAEPLAGIVGYSGRLVGAEVLGEEVRSRPPILLVHGTHDPVVPYESLAEAETGLQAVGLSVETVSCYGVQHSIDQEGLRRGDQFLRGVFSAQVP